MSVPELSCRTPNRLAWLLLLWFNGYVWGGVKAPESVQWSVPNGIVLNTLFSFEAFGGMAVSFPSTEFYPMKTKGICVGDFTEYSKVAFSAKQRTRVRVSQIVSPDP